MQNLRFEVTSLGKIFKALKRRIKIIKKSNTRIDKMSTSKIFAKTFILAAKIHSEVEETI